jgi:3',5'-cyclic-nucleotide phosphodiesterase
MQIANPAKHPSFFPPVDGAVIDCHCSVYLIPLLDMTDNPFAVLEVMKDSEIGDDDVRFGEWLTKKMKLLKRFIDDGSDLDAILLELEHCCRDGKFASVFFGKAASFFNCRACEVWKFQTREQVLARYDVEEITIIPVEKGGLAFRSIECERLVNVLKAETADRFCPSVDTASESSLCVPFRGATGNISALVLRGSKRGLFSSLDEANLRRLVPHVLLRLDAAAPLEIVGPAVPAIERELLVLMREITDSVTTQSDPAVFVTAVLEKAARLAKADRYSLFLVSENRDSLWTFAQSGLRESITLPFGKGIAGHCVSQQKMVGVTDAYQSPLFHPNVDNTTGYRTRSVLAVPLFNSRGDVFGSIELLIQELDGSFTAGDCKVVQILAMICGVALENANLFEHSGICQNRLAILTDSSIGITRSDDFRQVILGIVRNAAATINATSAAFYFLEAERFKLIASEGDGFLESPPFNCGVLHRVYLTGEPVIDNAFSLSEVTVKLDSASVIMAPVTFHDSGVLGILVVASMQPLTTKELEMVLPFAAFCGSSIHNAQLIEQLRFVDPDSEIQRWMSDDERVQFATPDRLSLSSREIEVVLTMNCFAPDFAGIGHFKELFFFFQSFNFFELFQITAERFFRFLTTLSRRYTDTSYHNWTHACDVTQCIFFMVKKGNLCDVYERWEVFTLLLASVCHDTNHRGLNNMYNVRAETPLGILFKDQSVMEVHHVHESIPIITRPGIDLFGVFDAVMLRKVWNVFIKIILATDMAKHFEIVRQAHSALDDQSFSMDNPDMRTLGLKLLIKLADISNVSRPFAFADQWCDILNKEFFHQGDLEIASGIGLSSPLNDRQTAYKPKSQIGFYNFICLPLYTVVAKLYPPLEVLVASVRANLEKWKQLAASQP